jgi:hypothetical protein
MGPPGLMGPTGDKGQQVSQKKSQNFLSWKEISINWSKTSEVISII